MFLTLIIDLSSKNILKRVPIFPHGSIKNLETFRTLRDYIRWIKDRIAEFGEETYKLERHAVIRAADERRIASATPRLLCPTIPKRCQHPSSPSSPSSHPK